MKNFSIRQSGYTLIELLLYIAIISTLLVGITAFFGLSAEARIKDQSVTEVNQQGTAAMEYITQAVRNATSVSSPTAGGNDSSLILVVPTGSLSPTIFSLNGTVLQVQEASTAAVALTSAKVQVSGLVFKNLTRSGTNGAIQITFTVSRTSTSGRPEFDYQKTFTTTAEVQW